MAPDHVRRGGWTFRTLAVAVAVAVAVASATLALSVILAIFSVLRCEWTNLNATACSLSSDDQKAAWGVLALIAPTVLATVVALVAPSRWKRALAVGLVVALVECATLLVGGRDCSFDREGWMRGMARDSDVGRFEALDHELLTLVECRTLNGATQPEVRALLGTASFRSKRAKLWNYEVGVPEGLSDYPGLDVEFPRFRGHLTTGRFGRSERMSVDAEDPPVFP